MATLTKSEVDSRAYAFVYPICSREHLPADFVVDAEFNRLIAGVFLPQEQCGRFNKPRYPAHILLLLPDVVIAATHPSAGAPIVRIPTSEVLAIESFRILLDGKLTLNTAQSTHQWRYNTREGRHVDEFVFHLRGMIMPEDDRVQNASPFVFGSRLDLKFTSAEASELDPGERILTSFFSSPRQSVKRRWLFDTHVSQPGDYLALTSRRILWITDRDGAHRSEYGTISTYAPLKNLLGMRVTDRDVDCELNVEFRRGLRWTIPIPADLRARTAAFVDEVRWLGEGNTGQRNS
jgi:hypothetical protein